MRIDCSGTPKEPWTSRPKSRLNFWSVPPSSTSASDRDRVVALQDRVEQLEHGDRLVGRHPLGEVVALEEPRHREPARDPEELVAPHREPLAVHARSRCARGRAPSPPARGRSRALASICSSERTGRSAERAARVPHPRRVVADDQHHGVAGVLELRAACAGRRRGPGGCRARSGRSPASPAAACPRARRRRAARPAAPPGARRRRPPRGGSRPPRRRSSVPGDWGSVMGPMLDSASFQGGPATRIQSPVKALVPGQFPAFHAGFAPLAGQSHSR